MAAAWQQAAAPAPQQGAAAAARLEAGLIKAAYKVVGQRRVVGILTPQTWGIT